MLERCGEFEGSVRKGGDVGKGQGAGARGVRGLCHSGGRGGGRGGINRISSI